MADISPVLEFLSCRTPEAWLAAAAEDLDTLLLDHASLELKAAQQAQKLIWSYGLSASRGGFGLSDGTRLRLVHTMSRLSREELRHFEKVIALLEKRGRCYEAISASRYAAGLHALVRADEPGKIVDTLIVGAIIEARSCERFYSLIPRLEAIDEELAAFYESLLKSEARHFRDYLALAEEIGGAAVRDRVGQLLRSEASLIESDDTQFRFHSGVPASSSH